MKNDINTIMTDNFGLVCNEIFDMKQSNLMYDTIKFVVNLMMILCAK